ncbi:MAG: hypothetical protein WKF84_05145 [Pyrinomonadaceae bacterium]
MQSTSPERADGLQDGAHAPRRHRRHRADLHQALDRAGNRLEELRPRTSEAAPRPDVQAIEDSLTHLEELIDRALQTSLSVEKSHSLAPRLKLN